MVEGTLNPDLRFSDWETVDTPQPFRQRFPIDKIPGPGQSFVVLKDVWVEEEDELPSRTIIDLNLVGEAADG